MCTFVLQVAAITAAPAAAVVSDVAAFQSSLPIAQFVADSVNSAVPAVIHSLPPTDVAVSDEVLLYFYFGHFCDACVTRIETCRSLITNLCIGVCSRRLTRN